MSEPLIIIQARLSSTRLPGKVLMNLGGRKVIDRVAQACERVAKTVIAIPYDEPELEEYLAKQNYDVHLGSPDDVLRRYYECALEWKAEQIVRVTADCPLLPVSVIQAVVKKHKQASYAYTSNTLVRTFPKGYDVEAFDFRLLEQAHKEATNPYEREHVTPYIKKIADIVQNVSQPVDQSMLRCTLDTQEDYDYLKAIIEKDRGN
jgi:spore coat polysaccharide biosynthesis protein SpsF (cytidylyltransferase family)